jgi:hypothetical protein
MKNALLKSSVLALALAFGGFANAADSAGSEFFHKAAADKWEVTPFLGWSSYKSSSKATSTKASSDTTFKTTYLSAIGEYGINSMWSVGLNLGLYTNRTTSADNVPDTKTKGLPNPDIYVRGASALGGGALHYGADLSVGLSKHKTETNGDESNSDGRLTLTPYVGWDMTAGPGFWGARLAFDIFKTVGKQTVETATTSTDSDVRGDYQWNVATFYEWVSGTNTLGGELMYQHVGGTNVETAGTKAGLNDTHTDFQLKVYDAIWVTPTIAILPDLTYTSFNFSDDATTVDKESGLGFDVGARFVF